MREMVPGRPYDLPAVAVVGWIPYYGLSAPLPGPFGGLNWPLRFAARFLFAAGNPPPNIGSAHDLDTLINSKEFRVAIGLSRVRATLDRQGDVHISAVLRTAAGFTPVTTVVPPWPRISFPAPARRYEPGAFRRQLRNRRGHGNLRLDFGFKIGAVLNRFQSMLTFHLAPWAMARVRYRVYPDGNYEIEVHGSDVPSLNVYVDWQPQAPHDMTAISGPQFRDFIAAGSCKKAPTARIFHVQDRVRP